MTTWPFAARAQQKTMPVIGYLSSISPEVAARGKTRLLHELEKAGFVAGRNVAIEYRYAGGQVDQLPALAAELVRFPVTVLVASGVPAAVAAKKATATIPIVFGVGADPVQLGLVASLSRPTGNATGVNSFSVDLGPKRLSLLRDMLPQPGLIAVLFGPSTASTPMQLRELEAAAQTLGQPILVLHAQNDDEVEKAFATMEERRANGLIYGASVYFQTITDKLIGLAARYRIPAMYEWREFVIAGGLMSYSTSRSEADAMLADYVVRVLKSTSPADLPVVQSSRLELVINLKTAKTLDLTIPPSLFARADEVIE
jgi:putative ABC transport system substrate-binding protein